MILLKEFAEGRNVSAHTVATYIRRHPEPFEGHTSLDGNKLQLDEEAVAILEKVYPAPLPDEIWSPQAKQKYDELVEELRETNREIRKLNEEKRELRQFELKYRALESEQKLLVSAAVNEKTAELQKEIGHLEGFIQDAKDEIEALNQEKVEIQQQARQEVEDLRKALEEEKAKSWWQKLIGK